MPSPVPLHALTARTRCRHQRTVRTGAPAVPSPYQVHPAQCYLTAVTVDSLAVFLPSGPTPAPPPSPPLVNSGGSEAAPACPLPGEPPVPSACRGSHGQRTFRGPGPPPIDTP